MNTPYVYSYLNDDPDHEYRVYLDTISFPGGEQHVRLSTRFGDHKTHAFHVVCKLQSSDDIMLMLLTVDALRREVPNCPIDLEIPYLPYARQDRIAVRGDALSIVVMANLINSLICRTVTVWDAHSSVSLALINNIVHVPQHVLMMQYGFALSTTLVSPDQGASKKVLAYKEQFTSSEHAHPIVYADKKRDPVTGKVTGAKLIDVPDYSINNSSLLIVDDICDGGRTFTELASLIRAEYPQVNQIDLYVTHGIFSKGFGVFDGLIDTIYCPNPLYKKEHFLARPDTVKVNP